MSQITSKDTKEQIMAAFGKLLAEHKKTESRIATKEEEVEKEKNQELLDKAQEYTVNKIVNEMAALQLDFGNIIGELADRLDTEAQKLDELKLAIAVGSEQLENLKKIRLVADALHILEQEHQGKLKILHTAIDTQRESLEKQQQQTHKIWDEEGQEFTIKIAEERDLLIKQREKAESDFDYEKAKKRKLEADEYETLKRNQEREIAEANQEKEKDWIQREKFLADNQKQFTENQKKITTFEDTLNNEYNKAKAEAIKEAEKDAKVKSDLLEKEWEGTKQGYELQIQSLEATIQRQIEQLTEITNQLQAATTQSQNLAMRAFQSTNSN